MGKKKPEKQLTVKLRAYADTPKGKLIEYMRTHADGLEELVFETIAARLMPFVLELGSKVNEDLAIQYIEKCVSYAASAQKRWNLSESPKMSQIAQSIKTANSALQSDSLPDNSFMEQLEFSSKKQQQQENLKEMDALLGDNV